MNRRAPLRLYRALSLPLILTVFLAVMVLTAWTGQCRAQAPASNLYFILDASGSMWGQVEGKAKIDIAKEVLTGLIRNLPAEVRVGLTAYGHRKKGDCNDVEELTPLGPLNKNALINTIKAISPKGMTPITLSVEQTAKKLRTTEQDSTIILVSDGKETCAGDPCALVEELRKSGAKFIMHVVGFDVTKEEKKQLECMAKAGGGNYYTAKGAGQLRLALEEVMAEALAENLIIRAVSTAGWPTDAKVQVFAAQTKEQVGARDGKRVSFKLPAGTYDVSARLKLDEKQVKSLSGLEVKKYEKLEKKVVFSVGRLGGWAKDASGTPLFAHITIFSVEDGQEKRIAWDKSRKEPLIFDVAPGTYKMVLMDEKTKQEMVIENIQVGEGQEVIKEISFAQGRLGIWAKDTTGKPIAASITIAKVVGGQDRNVAGGESMDKPRFFDVAPGTYKIILMDRMTNEKKVIENIKVEGGQEVIKETSFAQARLGVWVKDAAGKPIAASIRVLRVEGGQERNVAGGESMDKPRFFDLAPGTYKIILMDRRTKQEKAVENIRLDDRQEVIKDVRF